MSVAAASAHSVVRARIPVELKERAAQMLDSMGLNLTDFIRMSMIRLVDEGRLPFEVAVPSTPNALTRKVLEEVLAGENVETFDTPEALFKNLGI